VAWGVILTTNWRLDLQVSILHVIPGRPTSSNWYGTHRVARWGYAVEAENRDYDLSIALAAGWPFPAVTNPGSWFNFGTKGDVASILQYRIPTSPGFAIDTLFYAAMWFFGLASAVRVIRAKRGRCPQCGYDIRGGVISDQ
jgi:hypothetical protein